MLPAAPLLPLLLPALLVLAGACTVLVAEAFLARDDKHAWLPWIAAAFLVAAGLAVAAPDRGHLYGLLAWDGPRAWLSGAVIASALCGIGGLQTSLARDRHPGGEGYALILFAAFGAVLMVMAADALALFIALETASLAVYALVGLRRQRAEGNEGLLKYLVMGAAFSAVFLLGLAITYGATGGTAYGLPALPGREGLLPLGAGLMAAALLFKVGAVPFHFWSPDAYTGAPVAVTGFMGSALKVGGFAALGALWLSLVAAAGGQRGSGPLPLDAVLMITPRSRQALMPLATVLLWAGLLSLWIGNFSALRQDSVRRLVAFSSVSHAGYMLLAFALPQADSEMGFGALWVYLVAYALATAGALAAVAALSGRDDAGDTIPGLAGQARAKPLHGLALTVFIAAFAGLPPTLGFLGKFSVLSALVANGYWKTALFAMAMAVVGAVYYLRLLASLWAGSPRELAPLPRDLLGRWTIAGAALATVLLLAWPQPLLMGRHLTQPTAAAIAK